MIDLSFVKSVSIKVGDRAFENMEAAAIYARDNGYAMVILKWEPVSSEMQGGEIGKKLLSAFWGFWKKGTDLENVSCQLMWTPNEITATEVAVLDIKWSK